MGFLDGLKKLGLGAIEEEELYETPQKKKVVEKKEEPKKPILPVSEESLLFDKKYTCPVCDIDFSSKTVRAGKVRPKTQDMDLRNVYTEIDTGKYDIVTCPNCGYSALPKFYGNLTKFQINEIKSRICDNYQQQDFSGATYSYAEARDRYELAIATAMVKKARTSEKAYLCLKMAWVIRGESENLPIDAPGRDETIKANKEEEKDLLKKALDGFVIARQSETPPIAGMDALTLDYLMAALGIETGDYELATKLLGNLIVSRDASSRLKEKARDLKDMIPEKKNREQE